MKITKRCNYINSNYSNCCDEKRPIHDINIKESAISVLQHSTPASYKLLSARDSLAKVVDTVSSPSSSNDRGSSVSSGGSRGDVAESFRG